MSDWRLQYSENFDPKCYLQVGYPRDPSKNAFEITCNFLKIVCEIFEKVIPTNPDATMLDFGCGPSIAMGLCASGKVANISCADYLKCNQEEILKWINRYPNYHDWNDYYQFIGELKKMLPEEIETRTRSAIKEVLFCDALAEDPVEPSRFAPFDIITSSLALHAACPDAVSFNNAVHKLSVKLKPNGHFIICGTFGADFYKLEGKKFPCLSQSQADVEAGLKQSGLHPLKWWIYDVAGIEDVTNASQYYVVCAEKI